MKLHRFSILTMLLLTTILGLVIFSAVQNIQLAKLRTKSEKLAREIGAIGPIAKDSIAIRQVFEGGELNTWRFRVIKPASEYEYCVGIVDLDPSNTPVLPSEYRPNYQVVESKSQGETTITLSVWRNLNSRWTVKFQEFENENEKVATATRMDGFSDAAMANVVDVKNSLIQSNINPLSHFNTKHGDVIQYRKDEIVFLVRAEKPGQPEDARQAFVLAIRPRLAETTGTK